MTRRISVIIPTKNRAETLEATLRCLGEQTLPSEELEVVVIDDGSEDVTPRLLREARFPFRLVSDRLDPRPEFCPARPRNRALQHATGEFLLFLDADVLAGPRLLEAHLARHLAHGEQTAVIGYTGGYTSDLAQRAEQGAVPSPSALAAEVGRLTASENPDWRDSRETMYAATDELRTHPAPWQFFWTNNASVSRRAALEAGGFDEGFVGWGVEDVEFAYRLSKNGVCFVVAQEARALHYPHAIGPQGERQRTIAANRRRMLAKHAGPELELIMWAGRDGVWAWNQVRPLAAQPPPALWSSSAFAERAEGIRMRHLPPGPVAWYGPVPGFGRGCSPFHASGTRRSATRFPLVGVFSPWEDRAFSGVIVWDYWKWVPSPLLQGMVREGVRTGGAVLLVDSGAVLRDPAGIRIEPHESCLEAVDRLGVDYSCELLREQDAVVYRIGLSQQLNAPHSKPQHGPKWGRRRLLHAQLGGSEAHIAPGKS